MNTYYVTVAANAETPPQEFYCDANKPGHAIAAVLEQLPQAQAVVVACHLYASDQQGQIADFFVINAKARSA